MEKTPAGAVIERSIATFAGADQHLEMSEAKQQFSNFKEAFCAYYRCEPKAFSRKALFLGIPVTRRLLAIPIYVFNRAFFAIDMGIIESLGEARSSEEFSSMLDELSNTSRLERSIRRGLLGIRVSGGKLMAQWQLVAPYVLKPVLSSEMGTVTPKAKSERPVASEAAARTVSLPVVVARRLHRAATDVTCGKPVDVAARDAGLAGEAEFLKLLAQGAGEDPALQWLQGQMLMAERLRELERDNAGLRVLLGDKELQIQRLKGEAPTASVS